VNTVKLGSSELFVSEVCLGSMTWGKQNSQQDANEQIEYALGRGVNFIDTAEMYAVPPGPETYGLTEQYIGNWLAKNQSKRQDLILASKIVGGGVSWIRNGDKITGSAVTKALESSLMRLQTDYLDLYQLHWPNRTSPHFSKHWPQMVKFNEVNVEREKEVQLDILYALDDAMKAGKIRSCGLSNDTPWGLKEYLNLAKENNLPKVASVQNEFSLLHLKDSPYLMESCILDDVAYLPWSPMAAGALSGKYRNGLRPDNSRWSMQQRHGNFRDTVTVHRAIEAYYDVAKKYDMSLAQLSLAWVYQFKGVTSTIIGATSLSQLKENIDAYDLSLNENILMEVSEVIRSYPVPF